MCLQGFFIPKQNTCQAGICYLVRMNQAAQYLFLLSISLVLALSCKNSNTELQQHENIPGYADHLNKLKYFDSGDGQIAYIDEGSGPVILLVHGVPTSSWLYRNITPALVDSGYRVIAPDMLGFGASDKPADPSLYTPDKMAQRLLKLMNALEIENWAQVFHDAGGLWTWEMLEMNRASVSHLFMLNTIVYEEGFKPPMRFSDGPIARAYVKQYTSAMGQKVVITSTFRKGIKDRSVINKTMLEGYKAAFLDENPDALYYFFTHTCNSLPDYNNLHKGLDIPLTVIWGKHDDILVWHKISEAVKSNFSLNESDIHLLDAGHFIQEEKPEEIAAIIHKAISL